MVASIARASSANYGIANRFIQQVASQKDIQETTSPNDLAVPSKLEEIRNSLKEDKKFQKLLKRHSATDDYLVHLRKYSNADGTIRYLVIDSILVGRPLKEPGDFKIGDLKKYIYEMPSDWTSSDTQFSFGSLSKEALQKSGN